jgi:glutamyl-tRNA synthetase
VGKSSAIFNPDKLLWLNSQYIMSTSSKKLAELVTPILLHEDIIKDSNMFDSEWLSKAIDSLKERSKTLVELAHSLRYYIAEEIEYDSKARAKFLNEKSCDLLQELYKGLSALTDFSVPEIEKVFALLTEKHGVKLGKLAQPARVAVTGRAESPGIYEVLEIIKKEKTLRRLEKAIRTIESL